MSRSHSEIYVLSHRRDDVKEEQRLNLQHEVIKQTILNGQLIHQSIEPLPAQCSIADLGCGTGVWLDDVSKTFFGTTGGVNEASATLVGFDSNTHAFDPNLLPRVRLIKHDCTTAFDAKYIGAFDLVNIRGLAYALKETDFACLIENAIRLLSQEILLQSSLITFRTWRLFAMA